MLIRPLQRGLGPSSLMREVELTVSSSGHRGEILKQEGHRGPIKFGSLCPGVSPAPWALLSSRLAPFPTSPVFLPRGREKKVGSKQPPAPHPWAGAQRLHPALPLRPIFLPHSGAWLCLGAQEARDCHLRGCSLVPADTAWRGWSPPGGRERGVATGVRGLFPDQRRLSRGSGRRYCLSPLYKWPPSW